jgi:predicted metal-dependent phosphoesterase TrpH
MTARQPFTALCSSLTRSRFAGRVDLHLHSTHSDGLYTPADLVDLARRSGLSAIALTDHDTLGGVVEAQNAAVGSGVEVVAGVEITCEFRTKELHLLAYFVRPDYGPLNEALTRLRSHRVERFREMLKRLRADGVSVDEDDLCKRSTHDSLGRRHLAELLVKAKRVGSLREAFARYLKDGGRAAVPKVRLPVHEALLLVQGAGGVASWAHPSYDCTREALAELQGAGLGAVEVEYPTMRPSRARELRQWARALGMAVSGGSDCHGPDQPRRAVGAATISADELEELRTKI